MKKLLSLLLLFTFGLSSCEKDDICDANTPTTPRVIIKFYDYADSSKEKLLNNLKVVGDTMTNGIVFNESATDSTKYLTSANNIAIPLKVNDTIVTYKMTYNSTSTNRNTDVVTIIYSTQNVYVSRACGFKTIFDIKSIVRTDPDGDTIWMTQLQLLNPHIESENETHVKVFF